MSILLYFRRGKERRESDLGPFLSATATQSASPESVSIAADPSPSLSACDRGNRTLDFVLILELLPTPVEYDAK